MKKIIALTAIVFFAAQTFTFAQTTRSFGDNPMELGIKGGINFTNFYTDAKEIKDENLRMGFHAGLYSRIHLGSVFSIQPELLYTQKGATYTYGETNTIEVSQKFDYIQVPVLFDLKILNALHLHAGPYAAYMINASGETKTGSLVNETAYDKENMNAFDYGVAAGASFDLGRLEIGARYNMGLSAIGKDQNIGGVTYRFPNAKNSEFNAYVGLKL